MSNNIKSSEKNKQITGLVPYNSQVVLLLAPKSYEISMITDYVHDAQSGAHLYVNGIALVETNGAMA